MTMWGGFDNTSCMNGLFHVRRKPPTTQAAWADSLASNSGIRSCSSHAAFQIRSPSICLTHVACAQRCESNWHCRIIERPWSKVSVRPAEGAMILGKCGGVNIESSKVLVDSIEELEVMA
jgi:hypothetical protein